MHMGKTRRRCVYWTSHQYKGERTQSEFCCVLIIVCGSSSLIIINGCMIYN